MSHQGGWGLPETKIVRELERSKREREQEAEQKREGRKRHFNSAVPTSLWIRPRSILKF
jgi:hypothetical protein